MCIYTVCIYIVCVYVCVCVYTMCIWFWLTQPNAYCICRYAQHGPLRGTAAPVVGVLLYRKHVITEQPYITQLITLMEQVFVCVYMCVCVCVCVLHWWVAACVCCTGGGVGAGVGVGVSEGVRAAYSSLI